MNKHDPLGFAFDTGMEEEQYLEAFETTSNRQVTHHNAMAP
jgi:hypothetical protein